MIIFYIRNDFCIRKKSRLFISCHYYYCCSCFFYKILPILCILIMYIYRIFQSHLQMCPYFGPVLSSTPHDGPCTGLPWFTLPSCRYAMICQVKCMWPYVAKPGRVHWGSPGQLQVQWGTPNGWETESRGAETRSIWYLASQTFAGTQTGHIPSMNIHIHIRKIVQHHVIDTCLKLGGCNAPKMVSVSSMLRMWAEQLWACVDTFKIYQNWGDKKSLGFTVAMYIMFVQLHIVTHNYTQLQAIKRNNIQ